MPEWFRGAWTPEKVIPRVPKEKIKHSPMFLRRGDYSDNRAFAEVVAELLPDARRPVYEDGESFTVFLADLAHRTEEIILPIIEATTVMVPHTCIHALRDGLRISDRENRLAERVIPLLVVDQEWAHTRFFKATSKNPDGPRQLVEQGKALGAVVVEVTQKNLRQSLFQAISEILLGNMPDECST